MSRWLTKKEGGGRVSYDFFTFFLLLHPVCDVHACTFADDDVRFDDALRAATQPGAFPFLAGPGRSVTYEREIRRPWPISHALAQCVCVCVWIARSRYGSQTHGTDACGNVTRAVCEARVA